MNRDALQHLVQPPKLRVDHVYHLNSSVSVVNGVFHTKDYVMAFQTAQTIQMKLDVHALQPIISDVQMVAVSSQYFAVTGEMTAETTVMNLTVYQLQRGCHVLMDTSVAEAVTASHSLGSVMEKETAPAQEMMNGTVLM